MNKMICPNLLTDKIIDEIIYDLEDRTGIEDVWRSIPDDLLRDIKREWREIITIQLIKQGWVSPEELAKRKVQKLVVRVGKRVKVLWWQSFRGGSHQSKYRRYFIN